LLFPSAHEAPAPKEIQRCAEDRLYICHRDWGAGSLVTGLAIFKPTQAHYLTTLLGGYEWARWEHFWLTMGFCVFFLVHIIQVVLAGWNNFRRMVRGFEIRSASEPSLDAERKIWR